MIFCVNGVSGPSYRQMKLLALPEFFSYYWHSWFFKNWWPID